MSRAMRSTSVPYFLRSAVSILNSSSETVMSREIPRDTSSSNASITGVFVGSAADTTAGWPRGSSIITLPSTMRASPTSTLGFGVLTSSTVPFESNASPSA
eukprot:Amastigsp_a509744_1201.p3 type:complete len:101 gc:universal Amastigsp_a509744_1201:490-188(-)